MLNLVFFFFHIEKTTLPQEPKINGNWKKGVRLCAHSAVGKVGPGLNYTVPEVIPDVTKLLNSKQASSKGQPDLNFEFSVVLNIDLCARQMLDP